MNTPKKHDPERVRSAAVPLYDVTLGKTNEGYFVICWIDTRNRADIDGLYQQSINEVKAIKEGHSTPTSCMTVIFFTS